MAHAGDLLRNPVISTRLVLSFVVGAVLLPALAASAQTTRFRYDLRDDTTTRAAEWRRRADSTHAVSDRVNGCPARSDTRWAADPRATIPEPWLRASLRAGCRHADLPNAVRRRLRDDMASQDFYRRVVDGELSSTDDDRAFAIQLLSWSAEARHLPLFLRVARAGTPRTLPSGDYDVVYRAIVALAPYVATSAEARRLVERAAADPRNAVARQAGTLALAAANDGRSRRTLRGLPAATTNEFVRGRVANALAHEPCVPGTVFVEWYGVEGQNYSKCELPPDFR